MGADNKMMRSATVRVFKSSNPKRNACVRLTLESCESLIAPAKSDHLQVEICDEIGSVSQAPYPWLAGCFSGALYALGQLKNYNFKIVIESITGCAVAADADVDGFAVAAMLAVWQALDAQQQAPSAEPGEWIPSTSVRCER